MSGQESGGTDDGLNTLQSRRNILRMGGAALTTGLAGCAATLKDRDEAGDTSSKEYDGDAEEYRCREDVISVNILAHEALKYHHRDEDHDYIQQVVKDELEDSLYKLVEDANQYEEIPYTDVHVTVDHTTLPDKYSDSYAIFEGPHLDRWITEEYENSGDWQNHSNVVLRESTDLPSSLLGVAIMRDFHGDICGPTTQTCLVNYANLFGDYDERFDDNETWLPIVVDGESVDNMLVPAIVTTPAHEVGHTLKHIHRDGIADKEPADDFGDANNDRWWSSMMSSFYGIAFGVYGFPNTCQREFEEPEYMSTGYTTTWLDDIYLKNEFSDCAVAKFLENVNKPDRDRDPLYSIGPDAAVEAWSNSLSEDEAAELAELWDGMGDTTVSTVNIEDMTVLAEHAEKIAEEHGWNVRITEEDREQVRAIRDDFRDAATGDDGGYKAWDTTEFNDIVS